jgi:hypothetical protein
MNVPTVPKPLPDQAHWAKSPVFDKLQVFLQLSTSFSRCRLVKVTIFFSTKPFLG